MEILFNRHSEGQKEITDLLGFLSTDFSFERLKTDIELSTPDLVRFISAEVYAELLAYYIAENATDSDIDKYASILKSAQLYVLIMAYHDYASNNDLMHTTAGRKMNKAADETTPWDWQIASDNAAQMKRAYKVLDQLINQLEEKELATWLGSTARAKAKTLFVENTTKFDEIYPINNSAQLYYRMVPFMKSFEETELLSRLGATLYAKLKSTNELEVSEKIILENAKNGLVYAVLAKAYKVFPIEMFPDKISLTKNRADTLTKFREEMIIYLNKEAGDYFIKIENQISKQAAINNNVIAEPKDFLMGLDASNNHVDL